MSLPSIILLLMLLLVCGFVGTRLAEMLRLPHSVFWVVLGLTAGVMIRANDAEFTAHAAAFFPNLVLFIVLPPIVFESAFMLDLAALKRDAGPVAALAVIGLVVSTVVIG